MTSGSRSIIIPISVIVAVAIVVLNCPFSPIDRASGQPTYKLDVKPDLNPVATIKLDGNRVVRSEVSDDPGFRLQFHVRSADGKSVLTAEARSSASLELPTKTAGRFTVMLELFYPGYKGGTSQKGEFKPVSDILTFQVEAGAVTLIPLPRASAIY